MSRSEEFEELYRRWKEACLRADVMESSSDAPYIDNEPFGAIVAMGREAVPWIIEKLETDPDAHFLVHALARITGRRFTDDEIAEGRRRHGDPLGNQGLAAMWIDWWRSGGDRER